MSVDPRPSQPLPPHPSLEQQRKRARELLNGARAQESGALFRFAAALPRLAGRSPADIAGAKLSLHEAQLVIARESGFPGWPKLKAHIDSLKIGLTFERYSASARRVLFFSRLEASEFGSPAIETEHVLLGLLRDNECAASRILLRSGMSRESLHKEIAHRTPWLEKVPMSIEIPFSAGTKRVLQCAIDEADRLMDKEISVEHLLLGMLHEPRSVAGSMLMAHGMKPDRVRQEIIQLMAMTPVGSTSRWVAAGRALETEAADPLFSDPFARELAGAPGFALLATMRAAMGVPTAPGPEPYFSIRTKFLDEAALAAVRTSSIRQIAVLAAGMDTRAFRLEWPAGLVLYEVDRQEIFDHKEAVLGRMRAQPACDRRIVPADLTGPWIEALVGAGFDPARPSAILVEGLLPYLDEQAVTQLFQAMSTMACEGSWLGLDAVNREMLVSPYLKTYLGKLEELGCPWRFGVDDPQQFLAEHGWQATIVAPGEPEANYGRWPYPVASPTFAGLPVKIPRIYLVHARRMAG